MSLDTTGKANADYRAVKPHRAFLIDPGGRLVQSGLILPDTLREYVCGKPQQP